MVWDLSTLLIPMAPLPISLMAMDLLVVVAIRLLLAMVQALLVAVVTPLPLAMVLDRRRLALFQQDPVMGEGSDRKAALLRCPDRC
jgi:hypothetical protein